eukprot:11178747-Lingulodinium_polyedra.AAC.1
MGRAHWETLKTLRKSGLQVYTDLSSAFASVVRELTVTQYRSEETAAFIFAKFALPPGAMDDLRMILRSPDSLDLIGA